MMEKSNEESIARGRRCILQGLWEKASFNTRGLERSEQVVNLLELASTVSAQSKTIVDPLVTDEVGVYTFSEPRSQRSSPTSWKCFELSRLLIQKD